MGSSVSLTNLRNDHDHLCASDNALRLRLRQDNQLTNHIRGKLL